MITSSLEIITPEKAAEYLEKNTNNYRRLNKHKVAVYAEDIRTGNWETNGESVVFGEDGILKDGQHRLAAVVEANKPIMVVVVRGVDNSIGTYDVGMGRTIAQIAKAEGVFLTHSIIGAANILHAGFHDAGGKATVKQYIYDHYDEFKVADSIARSGNVHSVGRKASCCATVYCIRKLDLVNDDILQDFFWVFNNQNIRPGMLRNPSPALVAAKMFRAHAGAGHGQETKRQMSIIMQALKDFKNNANRIKSYVTENDDSPEALLKKVRDMEDINK